jgi:hypothetical protein
MAQIKVKCPEGHEFYMEDYERASCPKCGRVVVGPKAEQGGGGVCFLTTACVEYAGLPDDCVELQTMRRFRDRYIASLPHGDELLEDYYRTAPIIVRRLKEQGNSATRLEALLAKLRTAVTLINGGHEAEALELCKEELEALKREYAVGGA